jgi:hypothetical protein
MLGVRVRPGVASFVGGVRLEVDVAIAATRASVDRCRQVAAREDEDRRGTGAGGTGDRSDAAGHVVILHPTAPAGSVPRRRSGYR